LTLVGAPEAKIPELDDVDAGWEDDEEDDESLDSGWEDPEAADGPALQGLTPEEREARTARAAARKERQRVKAAEKAERRKARASAAAAKQKRSAPRVASARSQRMPERAAPRESEGTTSDDAVDEELAVRAPERAPVARRATGPSFDWRRVMPFVVILVVAVGVALYLWKR
jgi:hypothetical protein